MSKAVNIKTKKEHATKLVDKVSINDTFEDKVVVSNSDAETIIIEEKKKVRNSFRSFKFK